MTVLNIYTREVVKTNRNGRVNTVTSTNSNTSSSSSSGSASIDWASADSSLVTINRDLYVTGNITASKDVIAYFVTEASAGILDALTVSSPLLKTGSNISFDYDASQFDLVSNKLTIKTSILSGGGTDSSVAWIDIIDKPTTFAPAPHTIASHSDTTSYFTGTKALTASVADSANAVTWTNVSSKPTYFPPDSHTQDWSTITGKPSFFSGNYSSLSGIPSSFNPSSHSISSHSDVTSYFTGTKAYTAQTADNATSLGGTIASAFYNSNNFNKSTVAMTCSTLNATSLVVNGWTISISSGAIYFNNGSNRAKIDANGNLTCSGEVIAFGSV